MLQGYSDIVLRAEALEEQLVKARKHSTALQSKLDDAFAQYHNEVQDTQAKSDDLCERTSRYATRIRVRVVLSTTHWK
jgi:predicted  nucleic acid-binding Zn-ribbon protein